MMKISLCLLILDVARAFSSTYPCLERQTVVVSRTTTTTTIACAAANNNNSANKETKKKEDNKAMAFLRKKGKVGGSANMFTNSMGVDEGPVGRTSGGGSTVKSVRKAKSAYRECTESGVIDDMTEVFPFTSCGTQWTAFTDQVMGGVSSGSISREVVKDRTADVLRGNVSLANNGGFVQMAANLALDPSVADTVDASNFDGIELDVLYEGEGDKNHFNVHLRNPACTRQFSSYRATFEIPVDTWTTVRLPWSEFVGYGPGCESTPFDASALRRIGLVAIAREMRVFLALAGLRFYSII